MAEYTPETIYELIDSIDAGRVILPAMQRNFVWAEEKIGHLFDSIMRDYPIGTFLFWNIDSAMFERYAFNNFINEFDESKKLQRGTKAKAQFSDYRAVLDGQQRITSLYVGIRGKYRTHQKGKRWDDPEAYYDRFLCLNIMHSPEPGEEYQFMFKREQGEIEEVIQNANGENEYWVKVSDIFGGMDASDYTDEIESKYPDVFTAEKRRAARKMINCLQNALIQKQNVNYYLAKGQSLSEVVEIFVRVNNSGQPLHASDLMLSVATGEQEGVDIHVIIQDAIESINNMPNNVEDGFKVDKELLLTGGLLFTGAESLSLKNNENYSSYRMNEIFKIHWEEIIDAFKATVVYIEYLGFIGRKLPSKNLVLPIAYYFYKNGHGENYKASASNSACCDRIFIRQWLLRAMFNNLFNDGTGSTLLQIRNVIDRPSQSKHFPLKDLMLKEIRGGLSISNDQIDDILDIRYGDTKIIPLFSEMLHRTNCVTDQVDHIWPKSILLSKKALRKAFPTATEIDIINFKDRCNYLSNLQVLDRVENIEKSDTEFSIWLNSYFADEEMKKQYLCNHFIPTTVSYDFKDFVQFFEARKELLREQIRKAFPANFDEIVERYSLQGKLN